MTDASSIRNTHAPIRPDWWSKSVAGVVLGFSLAIALSGLFAWSGIARKGPANYMADRLLRIGGQYGGNLGNLLLGHDRSQQTILNRILCKDIAERGCYDTTDAVVVDRVDRRLAR